MQKFPYFQGRPHLPLILEYGDRQERFLPLLDSGADFSIFHRSALAILGLDWEQGAPRNYDNADGTSFIAREFILSVEIGGIRFPARISFADDPSLRVRPLLGRTDIFDKFRIIFCEQEQYVELKPYTREHHDCGAGEQ
ncbi:MAG TPA: aspartyl protease family protein [Thermoanaerobaculia bacterium]|nr:aspartyl protease family protein [Thermoanaerobaculia bacterium]